MTTVWLLMLLIVSYQSVDSQPTTDNQVCDGEHSSEMKCNVGLQNILQRLDVVEQSLALLKPRDCSEIYNFGRRLSGVYTVYSDRRQRPVEVYCDMVTDGGGWTVFQRRKDGSENFYRVWADYKAGFGNLFGEFWLGNDNLHLLTSDSRQRLRFDLADFNGSSRYAEYDNFTVGSAGEKYTLHSVGTYSGTAGNCFRSPHHLGSKFSTRDQDNDRYNGSCANAFKGGWWFGFCHNSNLNGAYLRGNHSSYANGVAWGCWTGPYYSLRFTEMKIKPFHVSTD